jgi:ribonuclease VapC
LIVDSSAIVAVIRREDGFRPILEALLTEHGLIPAPALVETHRVTAGAGNELHPGTSAFLAQLEDNGIVVETFTTADAGLAIAANQHYGRGNGRGGRLNMLDLMVYAVAKRTNLPILCTGRDFATTDIAIHPASRGW